MNKVELSQIDSLIFKIFHVSDDGKKLLELLKQKYCFSPCVDVNKPDWYVYFRDGENNMIRMLEGVGLHIKFLQEAQK